MPVIDKTYFYKEPLYIPNAKNVDSQPAGTPSNDDFISALINKHERQVLIDALGIVLYNLLIAALGNLEDSENLKWKKLVEGETYTNNEGYEYRWEGLRGHEKDSLIAYYVYCQYLVETESKLSTTGAVILKNEAAVMGDQSKKYVNAWQEFKKMYQGDVFVNYRPNIIFNAFGSYGLDYSNQYGNKQRSLLGYLLDKNNEDATNFPNLQFTYIRLQDSNNSFGF